MKFEVDTYNFNRAVAAIVTFSGRSVSRVIKNEASAIMKVATRETLKSDPAKVATAANNYLMKRAKTFVKDGRLSFTKKTNEIWYISTRRYKQKEYQKKAESYFTGEGSGLKGRAKQAAVRDLMRESGVKYYRIDKNARYRFPDKLWQQIQTNINSPILADPKKYEKTLEAYKKARLKAVGLAKQSWQLVNAKIKSDVAISGARARSGIINKFAFYVPHKNAQVIEHNERLGYYLELINYSKAANNKNARGAAALQTAIHGRVNFFIKNVQMGVFDNLETTLKKYPGLKIA